MIRIDKSKDDEISSGNLTRNNIMGASIQSDYPGTFDNNLVSTSYNNIYNSYENWDFTLKTDPKHITEQTPMISPL
ncbi:MAG: hypothetical protein R2771_06385 [Saprospiraceae bacterium]